jgi:3-oxoacyl-[acyl-carrier-protein] synthase III
MSQVSLFGMAVRGIVGCIPEKEVSNDKDYPWFEPAEIRKVTAMAGIKSRRVVDANTCTSDLCRAAAERLMKKLKWDPSTVDGLILVTQTQDYVMPSTSCILQHQLGLPETCAAFDVNLGCSAYVYGMWLSNSLLQSKACRRILLLTGETPSKFVDPHDRATALIFGDGGSATALEATPETDTLAHYVMMTDGKGAADLIVPGGMFRERFPEDRSRYCVSMDGGHVFDFTRSRVPILIQNLLAQSGTRPEDYSYFIFHQANEYLIKFLAGKAGVGLDKVPLSIGKFGNTGAASVPLTLAMAGPPPGNNGSPYQVMLLGFGVGLSWGGVSLRLPANCLLDYFVYGYTKSTGMVD